MLKTVRHALSIGLLVICAAPLNAQLLLSNGFEDWNNGLPENFVGPHTDMTEDRIQEIIFTPRTGAKALGLELGTYPETRITTLALPVEAGELYDFRFWVRGTGRIRVTVYDGRPENDGYAPFSEVVEINSPNAYQSFLKRVLAMNTTAQAEFVIAVEGTMSEDLLMIDDLHVTGSSLNTPLAATIADIQETGGLLGYSPLEFTFVRTQGIVTGLGEFSYFIQDAPGAWNGIQVRAAPPENLAVGDSITVLATVSEAGGIDEFWDRTMTQLIGVELLQIHATGRPLPEAIGITATEARREEWEGVRVDIADLECMNIPEPLVGEWTAANWLGTIVVDDLLYATWPTVGDFYSITGIIQYAGEPQLLPTGPADLGAGVGLAENVANRLSAYPIPAQDLVTIELPRTSGNITYTLVDATGRTVLQGRWSGVRYALDVSAVPDGAYLFTCHSGGQQWNVRVVVAH